MQRFDQDFADGFVVDLFSPSNRTLVLNQNVNPLGGQFVTGSTGESFLALQNYSYIIKTSDNAQDLIAKIEVPFDPGMLAMMGLQQAQTYVGKLAADGTSWVVDETTRNVHTAENVTRIIKMTSLDGEYRLLARNNIDPANVFVQYGQGATRTVNVTAGGRQDAEFIDGLRFSILSTQPMQLNVDIKDGVDPASLPPLTQSLNTYSWVVNTSLPMMNVAASVMVPCESPLFCFFHWILRLTNPSQSTDRFSQLECRRNLHRKRYSWWPRDHWDLRGHLLSRVT